jgi:DNA-binding MarR family transcriptional regulator
MRNGALRDAPRVPAGSVGENIRAGTLRDVAGTPKTRRRRSADKHVVSLGDAMVALCRLTEIALAEAEINLTQYRLLHHLHVGRTVQADLAFRLAISKQSVTRLVDPLVDKGYLTRRADRADRRRVIHAITPKGERALARTDAVLERYLMFVLQDLDDDTDVEAAKAGLRLFGVAAHKSYERVRPDGITPGRLSAAQPSKRAKVAISR